MQASDNMIQVDVSKKLRITRSSAIAWETGISIPGIMYLGGSVHLSAVSTDYIPGLEHKIVLDISGIGGDGVQILNEMVRSMRNKQEQVHIGIPYINADPHGLPFEPRPF